MAKKQKPASAKKSVKPVEKSAPTARKAQAARPTPQKKPAPAARPEPQKKPAPAPKAAPAPKPAPPAVKPAPVSKLPVAETKSSKSDDLKRRILERKTIKPIAFSLDEVREIAKKNENKTAKPAEAAVEKPQKETAKVGLPQPGSAVPPVPNHVKAASLADILGFNPNRAQPAPTEDGEALDVPEKFRRFFKLLIELRNHVLDSLGQHSEETLKRSAKEDAGDLSGYGQHMADAGTDTFDRDFALSLVSSEQDALSEVEAAIKRIRDGTYGICELTGKPISKDRLLVVPFTRYSAEAQKELEKTTHRSIQRAGIFADTTTEEGGKIVEEEPEE
jgi:RNA polymerase-binding transcription factor DksA